MGNRSTKSSLRNAIIHLNISADHVSSSDDKFWGQILGEQSSVAEEVIRSISTQEIRMLRDGSPRNFSLLAYKMVERLHLATGTLCNTQSQQTAVLNAIRVLTRIMPCVFEDRRWHDFFEMNCINSDKSGAQEDVKLFYPMISDADIDFKAYLPSVPGSLPSASTNECYMGLRVQNTKPDDQSSGCCDADLLLLSEGNSTVKTSPSSKIELSPKFKRSSVDSLMKTFVLSTCDLLFCPEFTALPHGDGYLSNAVDAPPEDLKSLSTYDYVWEPGVGFESNINSTSCYDKSRSELLRALLVSLSSTLYESPDDCATQRNHWMEIFVSKENRHALPLFTSLLNTVFIFKPSRQMIQFTNVTSHEDNRETLVGLALHVLLATLDYKVDRGETTDEQGSVGDEQNQFVAYMSRIHRDEDYDFMLQGFTRLLNSRLSSQGFLWTTQRPIELDLELMLLFWRICNLNRKFMLYLLNSTDTLSVVLPLLYHLNKNFQDPSRTALIHLAVFNLLILSGERNFGVKLNKAYTSNSLANLPEFSGSHADLMVIVFHKLIMYGYKINQLYDYLLNILVNISPYLKGLTMLASKCLIQLFETFSSPFVVLTEPNYHQIVIFLLEIFNNLIQYQFDGNANLIYMILTKKELFVRLAGMQTSQSAIEKVLRKLIRRKMQARRSERTTEEQPMCSNSSRESMDQEVSRNHESASTNDHGNNFFDFDLATVSCELCQHSSTSTNRQEVSLVATPDIHHFTQPTHPFSFESDLIGETKDSNKVHPVDSEAPSKPPISFDDILNQDLDLTTIGDGLGGEGNQGEDSISDSSSLIIKSSDLDKAGSRNNGGTQSRASRNDKAVCKKWRPSSEWLVEWKKSLPLHTILRMINVLVPQVDQFRRTNQKAGESEIIKFLQNGTLVGLLPVPHPILIRKYRTNTDSLIWFRACTWAIIYVKSTLWMDTDIRLIRIL